MIAMEMNISLSDKYSICMEGSFPIFYLFVCPVQTGNQIKSSQVCRQDKSDENITEPVNLSLFVSF